MADHAIGAARVVPGLFARSARSAGITNGVGLLEEVFSEQPGVGLLVVPDVGVSGPLLTACRRRLQCEQPRFEPSPAGGVALLHINREGLDEHGALGKQPAAPLVETNPTLAGKRNEAVLMRAVGPKRRIHRIRDHTGSGAVVPGGFEQAGLAQHAGERRRLPVFGKRRTLDQLVNAPCSVGEHVQLARMRFSKRRDIQRRVVQLLEPSDLFGDAVVAQGPDLPGFPVCVDVGAVEIFEARAVVDETAGHGTRLAMRV